MLLDVHSKFCLGGVRQLHGENKIPLYGTDAECKL